MDRTDTTAHSHSDRIARAAWFCAFVLPLALAAMLLGVKSAQAAQQSSAATTSVFVEEFELEAEGEEDGQAEDEFAQEECEIAEEEAVEGEISQAEAEEPCEEAAEFEDPGSRSDPGASGHRHRTRRHKHRHKKTCGHRAAGHKRHCSHGSRHR